MKIYSICRMALRTIKAKWKALLIIGIAISIVCFCFAGAILYSLHQEKSDSYEAVASFDSKQYSSDNNIVNIIENTRINNTIINKIYNASQTNEELQAKRSIELKEMIYLIVIGVICLFYSGILIRVWGKKFILESKDIWYMLRWIGMKEGDIRMLLVIQAIVITLIGIFIGLISCVLLSSFLPRDLSGTNIFSLPIPLPAAVFTAVVGISGVMLPLINIKQYTSAELNKNSR